MEPRVIIKEILLKSNDSSSFRTTGSFIQSELNSSIKSIQINQDSQLTLNELQKAIQLTYYNLIQLDYYDIVDIQLINQPSNTNTNTNNCYSSIIDIYLKEKVNTSRLGVGTDFENGSTNQVSYNIEGYMRNPTGNGENVTAKFKNSSTLSKDYMLSLSIPHVIHDGNKLNMMMKVFENKNSFYTSYTQFIQSLVSEYIIRPTNKNTLQEKLSAEISLRDEIPLSHPNNILTNVDTSLSTLSSINSSIKVAMKYSRILDTRNSFIFPTNGNYCKSELEVALPIGSTQYVNSLIHIEKHLPIFNNMILSVGGIGGYIFPFNNSKVYASDRYYNGGPMNLRGFHFYGIGHRSLNSPEYGGNELGDVIGGINKMNLGIMISTPFPEIITNSMSIFKYMRVFTFMNYGSLGYSPFDFGSPRVSIGTGMAMNFSNTGRVEMTYSLPIRKTSYDNIKPFQLGIGISIFN